MTGLCICGHTAGSHDRATGYCRAGGLGGMRHGPCGCHAFAEATGDWREHAPQRADERATIQRFSVKGRVRSVARALAKVDHTLRCFAHGQADGDVLVYPIYETNTLYVKRCGSGRGCYRVATFISNPDAYHRPGVRYACDLHRREGDAPITDAMLRGPIRGHHCHATADCTCESSPYREDAA